MVVTTIETKNGIVAFIETPLVILLVMTYKQALHLYITDDLSARQTSRYINLTL
jgi:hypothetical protein